MIPQVEGELEGELESSPSTEIQVISSWTSTVLGVKMLGFGFIFNDSTGATPCPPSKALYMAKKYRKLNLSQL